MRKPRLVGSLAALAYLVMIWLTPLPMMGFQKPFPIPRGYVSFDTAKNRIKVGVSTAMKDYWAKNAPVSYREPAIDSYSRHSKEVSLARTFLSWPYAARSEHGDYAEYHHRFSHQVAYIQCGYGYLKAPLHLLKSHLPTQRPPVI
ncbi:hypothetical transmembrane protein [Blumeria hordei DH14]|uniref:Hypothetical transmembrane protein n=1 Tax=Blumeria graminis f. sp. hordei (strain DH14) TaxID=546991 RepID=A0A078N0J7_BLUG1|nr:hypothetical transmembrane protein [Blumeria hordei DH14]